MGRAGWAAPFHRGANLWSSLCSGGWWNRYNSKPTPFRKI